LPIHVALQRRDERSNYEEVLPLARLDNALARTACVRQLLLGPHIPSPPLVYPIVAAAGLVPSIARFSETRGAESCGSCPTSATCLNFPSQALPTFTRHFSHTRSLSTNAVLTRTLASHLLNLLIVILLAFPASISLSGRPLIRILSSPRCVARSALDASCTIEKYAFLTSRPFASLLSLTSPYQNLRVSMDVAACGALVVSHASAQAVSFEDLGASGCLDAVQRYMSSFFVTAVLLPTYCSSTFAIAVAPYLQCPEPRADTLITTGNQPSSGSTIAMGHGHEIGAILRNAVTSPTIVRAIILRMVSMPCTTLAPRAVT